MDVVCNVGAMQFRLARVEHHRFAPLETRAFTLLPDGTEVRRTTTSPVPYLVVDHRKDDEAPARIEFWEPVRGSEAPIRGLITVCDALGSRF